MTAPAGSAGCAEAVAAARTLLFVPGDRPERFGKAAGSGADQIVIDLEDAVAPGRKETARHNAARWLADGRSAVVRINAVGTRWHADDVAMLAGHRCAVMLPKAEDPETIAVLAAGGRAGSCVVPLVETAAGVLRAAEICAAGVVRPAFGSVDLAVGLGVDPADREALYQARATLVLAAAASAAENGTGGGVTVVDGQMIDRPVVERALGLLARTATSSTTTEKD